jgi:hypothetical protein
MVLHSGAALGIVDASCSRKMAHGHQSGVAKLPVFVVEPGK